MNLDRCKNLIAITFLIGVISYFGCSFFKSKSYGGYNTFSTSRNSSNNYNSKNNANTNVIVMSDESKRINQESIVTDSNEIEIPFPVPDMKALMKKVKTGDLILRLTGAPDSIAIALSTSSLFSHIGIVEKLSEEDSVLVHHVYPGGANAKNGQYLEEFMKGRVSYIHKEKKGKLNTSKLNLGDKLKNISIDYYNEKILCYAIIRFKNITDYSIKKIVSKIRSLPEVEYDSEFHFDVKSIEPKKQPILFYCSEYIYYIYCDIFNKNECSLEPSIARPIKNQIKEIAIPFFQNESVQRIYNIKYNKIRIKSKLTYLSSFILLDNAVDDLNSIKILGDNDKIVTPRDFIQSDCFIIIDKGIDESLSKKYSNFYEVAKQYLDSEQYKNKHFVFTIDQATKLIDILK